MDRIIFLGVIFVLFMFFFTYFLSQTVIVGGRMGVGQDYQFHILNAQGKTLGYPFIEQHFQEYPPLFKWLSTPFGFQEKVFYFFCTFLIVLIVPLVLWFFFKDFFLVLGYFFVSNVIFLIDIIGAYPQILGSLLLLFFVFQKSWLVRLVLVFISVFLHRWLWAGLLLFWLCEISVRWFKCWKN